MSRNTKPLTPDEVRRRFRQQGITLTSWAEQNGYSRDSVYRVMGGQSKAYFGRAHKIAVALGLKVADGEPSTADDARNTQSRRVA